MIARNGSVINEIVTTYIEQGFAVVPIPSGEKGPIIPGWQNLRLTTADAFAADANCGIILGTASGGLVVVDLDHPTAVEMAAEYLPSTTMHGGHGERTHWFYRVDGAMKKRAYSTADKTLLVEILAEGQQCVAGPSVHPDGSVYAVLTGEPSTITQEVLLSAVERLTTACKTQLGGGNLQGISTSNLQTTSTLNDLSATLHRIGATVLGDGQTANGTAGFCVQCPGEHLHTQRNSPKDCMAWLGPQGGFQANCVHTSCGIHSWQSFRSACDPTWTPAGVQGSPTAPQEQSTAPRKSQLNLRHADELVRDCPTMRPAIIDGLLRTGETMNFISAPKLGKSWLATSLALSVVSGQKWLGRFWTRKGKVLICDNELHDATMANRIPGIAAAMGLKADDWGQGKLDIVNLRGELVDLLALCADLSEFTKYGAYDLIILDAFYRFVPRGYDENLNSDMAFLYNALDACAKKIGCSFIAVHHSSKGSQSGKSVVDTGAGAGSMARAADSHFVLRHHEEKDCVVVDAALRSFAPMDAFVLRWQYPTWTVADGLDPTLLRRERPTRRAPTATEDAESPADKKQRLFDEHLQTVMDAYTAYPSGETPTAIRDFCGMNSRTYGPIHAKLLRDKIIRPCQIEKNARSYPGAILVGDTQNDPDPDNPDKTVFSVSVSECESDTSTHTRTHALSLESVSCPGGVIADDVLNGVTKKRLSGSKAVRVKTKAKPKTTPKVATKKVATKRRKGSPITTNGQHPITTANDDGYHPTSTPITPAVITAASQAVTTAGPHDGPMNGRLFDEHYNDYES